MHVPVKPERTPQSFGPHATSPAHDSCSCSFQSSVLSSRQHLLRVLTSSRHLRLNNLPQGCLCTFKCSLKKPCKHRQVCVYVGFDARKHMEHVSKNLAAWLERKKYLNILLSLSCVDIKDTTEQWMRRRTDRVI